MKEKKLKEDEGQIENKVRNREYREINNLYKEKVYEKGQEVVRMIRKIIGKEMLRKGMEIYLERNEGDEEKIENLIKVFEDV